MSPGPASSWRFRRTRAPGFGRRRLLTFRTRFFPGDAARNAVGEQINPFLRIAVLEQPSGQTVAAECIHVAIEPFREAESVTVWRVDHLDKFRQGHLRLSGEALERVSSESEGGASNGSFSDCVDMIRQFPAGRARTPVGLSRRHNRPNRRSRCEGRKDVHKMPRPVRPRPMGREAAREAAGVHRDQPRP